MEIGKEFLVITGGVLVGFAFASIEKANKIRRVDCVELKNEYENSNNIPMIALVVAGAIAVTVGLYK